jgi:hypothetical protein
MRTVKKTAILITLLSANLFLSLPAQADTAVPVSDATTQAILSSWTDSDGSGGILYNIYTSVYNTWDVAKDILTELEAMASGSPDSDTLDAYADAYAQLYTNSTITNAFSSAGTNFPTDDYPTTQSDDRIDTPFWNMVVNYQGLSSGVTSDSYSTTLSDTYAQNAPEFLGGDLPNDLFIGDGTTSADDDSTSLGTYASSPVPGGALIASSLFLPPLTCDDNGCNQEGMNSDQQDASKQYIKFLSGSNYSLFVSPFALPQKLAPCDSSNGASKNLKCADGTDVAKMKQYTQLYFTTAAMQSLVDYNLSYVWALNEGDNSASNDKPADNNNVSSLIKYIASYMATNQNFYSDMEDSSTTIATVVKDIAMLTSGIFLELQRNYEIQVRQLTTENALLSSNLLNLQTGASMLYDPSTASS